MNERATELTREQIERFAMSLTKKQIKEVVEWFISKDMTGPAEWFRRYYALSSQPSEPGRCKKWFFYRDDEMQCELPEGHIAAHGFAPSPATGQDVMEALPTIRRLVEEMEKLLACDIGSEDGATFFEVPVGDVERIRQFLEGMR